VQAIDLMGLAEGGALPPETPAHETPAVQEARRAMEVCNACRYCEGFCAVFPAMELRREFAQGDLNYLANLCHACRGCYYACQYAPPHEFGINVPRVLAEVRAESYAKYAWPHPLARLYQRNGLVVSLAMALGVSGVLLLAVLLQRHDVLFGPQPAVPGQGFYNVIPYGVMVGTASATFLFALLAMGVGFARFWRDTGGRASELAQGRPLLQALRDAATLRYLGGGGHGCNDRDESFSAQRRWFHHLMAYGFLLCFASTSVATLYDHLLGWPAPYHSSACRCCWARRVAWDWSRGLPGCSG
jgi:citrate/tricarballylate utilization protein